MRKVIALILGIGLLAAGYFWGQKNPTDPRETVDRDIITGTKTTTFEVGEVVSGIQALNRINVFQAYLVAVTESKECLIWGCLIGSNQALISPGFVNYYIDMGKLNDINYDPDTKRLKIKLPPLMIERPNIDTLHQRLFTDGVLGQITGSARRLEQKTRPAAVKQIKQQAQSAFLVAAARRQAVAAVYANTRKVLNAANGQNVSLSVSF